MSNITNNWIYAGNLTKELTEGDIICVFSQYGEITNINLVRDKDTGLPKGFCFICYEDKRSSELAVDNFNGITLVDRKLKVSYVENYRVPKNYKEQDEAYVKLVEEGCAPKPGDKFPEVKLLEPKKAITAGPSDDTIDVKHYFDEAREKQLKKEIESAKRKEQKTDEIHQKIERRGPHQFGSRPLYHQPMITKTFTDAFAQKIDPRELTKDDYRSRHGDHDTREANDGRNHSSKWLRPERNTNRGDGLIDYIRRQDTRRRDNWRDAPDSTTKSHARSKSRPRSRSRPRYGSSYQGARSPYRYDESQSRYTRSLPRHNGSPPRYTRSPYRYDGTQSRNIKPPSKHTRSPSRHPRPPSRHPRPPSRHTRSPSRHPRPPSRHTRSPSRHTRSPSRHTRPPSRHTRSPSRYTRSPSRYTRSPSRYARSPSRYTRSSSKHRLSSSKSKSSSHDITITPDSSSGAGRPIKLEK